MAEPFYITTTLPYVNAEPHIGFALEIIQADTIARYHRLLGDEVFFNTGTDEHGLKIYKKALEEGKSPQQYCDEYAAKFENLKTKLTLSYDAFIRTTDEHHLKAAQEFWRRCLANGDIYKAKYKVKYCVGCELEKTESELVDGRCPLHPNLELEVIEEENYFFKFSRYQDVLLKLYRDNPLFVVPSWRLEEITNFVKKGLQDFSISRLKTKMPWGVEVPDDPHQVMYVWFDALVNYISTLGWPENEESFAKFWPGMQVAGKDNLRQQSSMWQAMLASAGLPFSRQILIHGFITAGGQKMSKSLGNVVDPIALVDEYGVDALRYYLLKEINPFEDGDFTIERFREVYNSNLANGLGNLVARITTLAAKYCDGKVPAITGDPDQYPLRVNQNWYTWKQAYADRDKALATFKFNEALDAVWRFLGTMDKYINDQKPWELARKDSEQFNYVLYGLLDSLHQVAWMIYPFLPSTSLIIADLLSIHSLLKPVPNEKASWTNIAPGTSVKTTQPLFPRV